MCPFTTPPLAVPEQVLFACPHQCGVTTWRREDMARHVHEVHTPQVPKLCCTSCRFWTLNVKELIDHVIDNHVDLDSRPAERACRHRHSNSPSWAVHKKAKGMGHRCNACGFRTMRKSRLQDHNMEHHWKVKKLCCTKCRFSTKRVLDLMQHMWTAHSL